MPSELNLWGGLLHFLIGGVNRERQTHQRKKLRSWQDRSDAGSPYRQADGAVAMSDSEATLDDVDTDGEAFSVSQGSEAVLDMETVSRLFAQKGGWERWLQCEYALALSRASAGQAYRCMREQQVWQNSAEICDLVVTLNAPGQPVAGAMIELKVEKFSDSSPVIGFEWESDIRKFYSRMEKSEYQDFTPIAIAVYASQKGYDDIQKHLPEIRSIGARSLNPAYPKVITGIVGYNAGVCICFPYLPTTLRSQKRPPPAGRAFAARAVALPHA